MHHLIEGPVKALRNVYEEPGSWGPLMKANTNEWSLPNAFGSSATAAVRGGGGKRYRMLRREMLREGSPPPSANNRGGGGMSRLPLRSSDAARGGGAAASTWQPDGCPNQGPCPSGPPAVNCVAVRLLAYTSVNEYRKSVLHEKAGTRVRPASATFSLFIQNLRLE